MAKVKKTQQQIIAENEKISDLILEDLRSKGGDNMDGEKRANEKLNIMTADLSKKMSIGQINKYISAYKSGAPVKDLLPKNLTKKDLIQLENIAKKRN